MNEKPKVLDTPKLRILNEQAIENNYNRQLDPKWLDSVDPDGIHVVGFTMVHEHAVGVAVEPHVRAQLFVKVKDQEKSQEVWLDIPTQEVWLDIPMAYFNELPHVEKDEAGEWKVVLA